MSLTLIPSRDGLIVEKKSVYTNNYIFIYSLNSIIDKSFGMMNLYQNTNSLFNLDNELFNLIFCNSFRNKYSWFSSILQKNAIL